jgi:hypothetical protein
MVKNRMGKAVALEVERTGRIRFVEMLLDWRLPSERVDNGSQFAA